LLRVDFDLLMSGRDAARAVLKKVFAFAGLRWDERSNPEPNPNLNPTPTPITLPLPL